MTENEFLLADRIAKIKSINEQYDLQHNAYLSFSGGKDSTVLHYLFDEALPGNNIPRVFINTGIDYDDIRKFVKELAEKDSRIVIYNSGVNITQMLRERGYPFKSKEHSQKVMEYRKGYRNKSILKYFHILPDGYHPCPNRLLYQMEDTTLSISELCCDELKKNPIKKWMKQNNRLITITGMRREEGGSRNRLNCIIADKDGKIKKFHPLSPVSEDFENWYIQCRNIKLCRLYYPPFNFTRTGCKGCPYALDLQQELDIMSNLLPNEYKQCETLWKPVYDEYRKIGFRLRKRSDYPLLEN